MADDKVTVKFLSSRDDPEYKTAYYAGDVVAMDPDSAQRMLNTGDVEEVSGEEAEGAIEEKIPLAFQDRDEAALMAAIAENDNANSDNE